MHDDAGRPRGGSPEATTQTADAQLMAVRADQLRLPFQIGEYRLLEKMGEGASGTVYRGEHLKLDRPVAVKFLDPRRLRDEQAVARFEREMRAVGRLDHPNLVRAYDARECDGVRLLVMEYVDGRDLGQILHAEGPLPIAEACELARQAALGLQAAHEVGLIHRDIKPSNLMLDRQGVVKILDLGLALFESDVFREGELTETSQTMGTADYIAPEQVTDTHGVDIRADIYSLGCTLYKLLCGRTVFSGPQYRNHLAKMMAHVHEIIEPIELRRTDVPGPLAAIVGRMVAKNRDDRFVTPGEVALALARFAAGADLRGLLRKTLDANRVPGEAERPTGSVRHGHSDSSIPAIKSVPARSAGSDLRRLGEAAGGRGSPALPPTMTAPGGRASPPTTVPAPAARVRPQVAVPPMVPVEAGDAFPEPGPWSQRIARLGSMGLKFAKNLPWYGWLLMSFVTMLAIGLILMALGGS